MVLSSAMALHTLQGRLATFCQRKTGPWAQRAKEGIYRADQEKVSVTFSGWLISPITG